MEEGAYAVHSLLKFHNTSLFFFVVFLCVFFFFFFLFFLGGGGGGGGGQAIGCIKLGTSLCMELHAIFNP